MKALRQVYEQFPEAKVFFFGGTEENVRLVEACVQAIAYFQENCPDEPIKCWVESVPADPEIREKVRRKLTDAMRNFFRSPEEDMVQGLYN